MDRQVILGNMNINGFVAACDAGAAEKNWPPDWHPLLRALALDRAGDWDAAHSIAQEDSSLEGSAVHAFLHREEGAQWNAEYWYRRAGRAPVSGSLEGEWTALAGELLG